ncbi:O-methyltransferase [Varibaculum prostatecancerukia]|uniref:O-methyltransferase n=1 Tax=Varibaculum prostatecancerukia TaxID=2811781 RepID=UPI001BFFE81B|nr:class I SAM-dependent methyltransferase [Varibaculum prostatecancerukia]
MNNNKALSWDWTESQVVEDEVTVAARAAAVEMGAAPVSPATGAALRMLSAACGAKAIFEIGTGAGVSGLYLLAGMSENGVLTTIDSESEFQAAARSAFRAAAQKSNRTRLINGHALEVLPRMAGAAYDLVVIDGDVREIASYIEQATRILRPGGMVAIVHALWMDQVGDPARREMETTHMRQAVTSLLEDERFIANVLTCGDGLAVGVYCPQE